jgi:hypothetical protein
VPAARYLILKFRPGSRAAFLPQDGETITYVADEFPGIGFRFAFGDEFADEVCG